MLSLLKQMVNQINPNKFQLNKTNSFGTDAPFLNLDLSITICIVPSKFIINEIILVLEKYFSFLDG